MSNQSDGHYRGGTGKDTFVVRNSPAQAIAVSILDFNQSEQDRIDLSSLSTTFGALLTWQDVLSGDTLIRVSGTATIRLVGLLLSKLNPSDFIF